MGKKGKKGRANVVYSTNPDFNYDYDEEPEAETLAPGDQQLRIHLDRLKGNKEVSRISGFIGSDDDLKDLAKTLKQLCGSGGSAKDGDILIQGNHRDKLLKALQEMGYPTKKTGG